MIKLPRLPDRTPVRLTLNLPPDLAQSLEGYQAFYADAYGQAEPLALLAPAMLSTFIENDRGFMAWRKRQPEIPPNASVSQRGDMR